MKTKILLSAAAVLTIIALLVLRSQALIFITAIIMAVMVIFALRFLGPGHNMKITRWAKKNPGKTKWLITAGIILAMAVGNTVGFDLRQLDYVFKDITAIVFGGIMVLGFLSIPFLKRRPIFTIPSVIFRDRLAYTCILVSIYALSVFSGNRAQDKYPDSFYVQVLQAVDDKIFSLQTEETDVFSGDFENPHRPGIQESSIFPFFTLMMLYEKKVSESSISKEEKKLKDKAADKLKIIERKMNKRVERLRGLYAAGASVGSVLLIILLAMLCCAGACMIIGGFAGGGIGLVIGGVFVLGGAIWGIVAISMKNREQRRSFQR